MRIGIFTDTYPPYINGVSTSIAMLEKALEKKGHQVFIVTVNTESIGYKYENENKIIRIPGIPIGIYDYRLTGIYPLRAIEKIKRWNLDVIHSHTEFGVGTFARIIAKQFDIPLVHTYHTMYEDYIHYITGGYFAKSGKKIVEYLTKFYCDKTATELIVPTKKTYDLFKEKYKVNRNVHIIPTGIEIERFYKENYDKKEIKDLKLSIGLKEEDFVIMFVGRLGKEKNVDFLIKNHHSVVKHNKNAKLVIIGHGPDADSFHKLTLKEKIDSNIIFTGKVPWEDISKYYQFADIFTTASKSETQGLTVIEAIAASVPVVCINDESFKDVIIDDLNGYLFDNKKDYVKSIIKIMDDKELYERLSNQGRISAELHSSKYFAEKVLDVYNIAIKDIVPTKKTFLNRFKKEVKRGIYGK
jgi:1,2-diacylglycerol 3-alpha-glucosyltransferase